LSPAAFRGGLGVRREVGFIQPGDAPRHDSRRQRTSSQMTTMTAARAVAKTRHRDMAAASATADFVTATIGSTTTMNVPAWNFSRSCFW
jgi:hypothetical protein